MHNPNLGTITATVGHLAGAIDYLLSQNASAIDYLDVVSLSNLILECRLNLSIMIFYVKELLSVEFFLEISWSAQHSAFACYYSLFQ